MTQLPLLAALGDSQTAPDDFWIPAAQTWVPVLQAKLSALGVCGRTHVVATGGHTTADMRARLPELLASGVPDVAIVYGGVNDASRKMPTAETVSNLRAILRVLAQAAREAGRTPRIVVVSPNYLNWPEGGDRWNVVTGQGARAAQNVPIWNAARDAAQEEGAAFCDLYAFQSSLIYGPQATDAPGSARWHVAPRDQHHNAWGHEIVAQAVLHTLRAQDGWLDALRHDNTI